MSGFDERGRPNQTPQPDGQPTYPGNQGGTNWYSPSFSPRTGLFYVSAWEDYASIYCPDAVEYQGRHEVRRRRPAETVGRAWRARSASAVAADQQLDRGGRPRRGDRDRSDKRRARSGSSR